MKLSAEDRDKQIYILLDTLLKEAKAAKPVNYPKPFTKEEVETLFLGHIWGHREITLTIVLARLLDPKFKASVNFYSCNPRSIYEGPIRTLLRKSGIPHKKSGPLNVAKNSQKINKDWAQNKRGDGMAMVVAELVKKIELVDKNTLREFALVYVYRYLQEAKKVARLNFKIQKIEDPLFLFNLSTDLISNVPDGGSTPQFIVGTLINNFNKDHDNKVITTGQEDSVSATNTTSKKPGDIIEDFPDVRKRIYEITVKKFSVDRMIESHEAIKAFDKNGLISEVFVICRKEDTPEEVNSSSSTAFLLGTAKYQDIVYYFISIFEWLQDKLLFMSAKSRANFYADLVAYVNEINTSEKVKEYFKVWHQKNPL